MASLLLRALSIWVEESRERQANATVSYQGRPRPEGPQLQGSQVSEELGGGRSLRLTLQGWVGLALLRAVRGMACWKRCWKRNGEGHLVRLGTFGAGLDQEMLRSLVGARSERP